MLVTQAALCLLQALVRFQTFYKDDLLFVQGITQFGLLASILL